MVEQSQNSFHNIFFGKDTISSFFKIIVHESALNNLSRDGKQEVINILVKNMKNIYKNLDTTKLSKSNVNSILEQFKKISITHTINDIKKNNIIGSYQQSSSDLKFNRDFNSNPQKQNQIMERPETTKNIKNNNYQNQFSGFTSNMGNYDSNFDSVFKPIVNEIPDITTFNSYEVGKDIQDIKTRMNSIQQARELELNMRNARPSTPDFLKAKNTNIRADSDNQQPYKQSNSQQLQKSPKSNIDFTNIKSSDFNDSFSGLSNDTNSDLFSLDNIDTPLVEGEIVEDDTSFEDRLKRLQSDRDNIKTQNYTNQQQKQIDFTDNNFPSTDMGSNTILQNKDTKHYSQENEQREKPLIFIKQQEQNNNIDVIKSNMKAMNIIHKDDEKYKQQIANYESYIINLKEEITKLKFESENNNEMEKINDIKNQIATEFNLLRQKNEEFELKQSNLNIKQIELSKKETEIKDLVEKYNYLFRTEYLQLEVSNDQNKSNYIFKINPIENVISIKLVSYSLPIPRFNIECDKNDTFKYIINSDENTIKIPTGNYTIDELVLLLNTDNKKINENITFILNTDQKIIIESSNSEDKIKIIPTIFSKFNLGFINETNENYTHKADNIWDLRIENKLYLYLINLSDEVPFGVLYFNTQSMSQFKFQDLFNLDKLEVIFKDSKGLPYNFNNLPHSLNFLIEKLN